MRGLDPRINWQGRPQRVDGPDKASHDAQRRSAVRPFVVLRRLHPPDCAGEGQSDLAAGKPGGCNIRRNTLRSFGPRGLAMPSIWQFHIMPMDPLLWNPSRVVINNAGFGD
ncbi:MAG: hypothetical protein WAS73_09525 [Defluviicoccus sp.]